MFIQSHKVSDTCSNFSKLSDSLKQVTADWSEYELKTDDTHPNDDCNSYCTTLMTPSLYSSL